jgi:hypothetical protein
MKILCASVPLCLCASVPLCLCALWSVILRVEGAMQGLADKIE